MIKKLSNQDCFSYGNSEVFEIMTGYDTENEKTEIDDFLLEVLENKYSRVTIIATSNSHTSSLERQYELLIKAVFLAKKNC